MRKTFPILNDLEAAASRLDRLGLKKLEIAEQLGIDVRKVRRLLATAAEKRAVIARITRLGLLGRSVDEIIEQVGGTVSDRTSVCGTVP